SLNQGTGADSSAVSLQTRSDRADTAFTVMADVVRNPAFANEELERARQQSLDGLQVSLSQPGPLASLAMARALYGDAPYGQTNSPHSLQAITHDDVVNFHNTYWRPDTAVLVITGDVSTEQGFALAHPHFRDFDHPASRLQRPYCGEGSTPPPPLPAEPDATAHAASTRTIVVDLPGTGQAAVAMGLRGISRRDADYFPLVVANSVLGGGYSARLNEEIRIKRGLSYGANSSLSARMAPGPIVASAQTRNDAAVQVYQLMSTEIARIGHELIPADELTARKAAIIGGFGRTVETTSGLAGQISTLALYGLPPEALRTYVSDINAVTPEQARAAAAKYYDPAHADVVVAGDASHFYAGLRRLRPNAERIPANRLNLERAGLD